VHEIERLWPDPDRRHDALLRCLVDVYIDEHELLTERQRRVLEAFSYGLNREQVAEALGVELETVKHHLRLATRALAAKSTTHAVALALRQGLIR
jgi:DNA-binding NarL/FixJ family response regulator